MAEYAFFFEVLIGGLMSGVLYSLVALGFVLIFKASGVFNFAQGAMVLFAALSLVRLMEWMPFALALLSTVAIMVLVAFVIERAVLRPLVGQHALILFMATIGVTFVLDGFGQTIWGSDAYALDLGISARPWRIFPEVFPPRGIRMSPIDVFATVVAGALVVVLSIFFHGSKIGRALRAVADDHQAAQSVGIPLNYIWLIVWSVAGVVALVAGMAWGSKLGVQFSLATVALKALPVLILGGLTSVPGAILGGLIIGSGEKLAEVYLGPALGGGIENWFAYVLALAVLLIRPQGLFGERIIERV